MLISMEAFDQGDQPMLTRKRPINQGCGLPEQQYPSSLEWSQHCMIDLLGMQYLVIIIMVGNTLQLNCCMFLTSRKETVAQLYHVKRSCGS